jgi:oxygen-independent coproporphyrinogen-3 oxidase
MAIAASLEPDRLAVFAFAYVPTLKPHQRRLSQAEMPGAVGRIALLRTAQQVLGDAGYETIGMDHFALPSDELARAAKQRRLWRDFQGYTVDRAAETVALGPSGISFVGGAYAQNEKSLNKYCAALSLGNLPIERGIELTLEDQVRRELITELMCNFELTLTADRRCHFASELRELERLSELVDVRDERIVVTPLGRLFVRNVAMVFDSYLRPSTQQFSRTV